MNAIVDVRTDLLSLLFLGGLWAVLFGDDAWRTLKAWLRCRRMRRAGR